MAEQMNVYQTKSQLSSLLKRVEAGEEFVIARAGDPVARLVPYRRIVEQRKPGAWHGRVAMAPDFDELPPDVAAAFDGVAEPDAPAA